MVDVNSIGTFEVKFKKFNEHISISKPHVLAKNIIFGGLFIDLDGFMKAKNHQTGHYMELKFNQRNAATEVGHVEGYVVDASG